MSKEQTPIKKGIKARGQYMHSMDCFIYQVQCNCLCIFEDWTMEKAEGKFNNHKCIETEVKPKSN
jgi:hypothetical protein